MKHDLEWDQAFSLAHRIKTELSPACERIEIAGSIRRETYTVGDIEIVAIPKLIPDMEAQLSLFGDPPKLVSGLDILIEMLLKKKNNFRRGDKNGPVHKNFGIDYGNEESDITLDLFLCDRENWGFIYALRTGPADYNQAWVTQKRKGGLLPDRYSFSGGRLYKDGLIQFAPEEKDVFDLIGGMIPAPDRDQWRKYYPVKNE